jgi:hypothetical protein
VKEVGEKYGGGTLTFDALAGTYDTKNASSLSSWYASGADKQVTQTLYDEPNTAVVTNTAITGLQSSNGRQRVLTSLYKSLKSNSYYDFASHYVYDIAGNVKVLFQELKPMKDIATAQGLKQINYDYDLVSGKVNQVIYQPGQGDQFIYRYEYDAGNRLTAAYSSRNGLQWQQDARYYYYLHGPLARTELGKYQVQGVDYAYTLQGWLKGINSQSLDPARDMAGDGLSTSPVYRNFGRDVYGFSIGYYGNDYQPIGGASANAFNISFTAPAGAVGTTGNTGSPLYNGNISYTTITLNKIDNGQTTGYSYLYDQLNRLLGTRQHTIGGTAFTYASYNTAYEERVNYDANGNIKTYLRKGAAAQPAMDNQKYFYYYTNTGNTRGEYDPMQPLPGDVKTLTNQLAHVDDAENAASYTEDIDDQDPGNYEYDNIGNLIKDNRDSITNISWTVYGKIRQIEKMGGVTIHYSYDAAGNRVVKEVSGAPGGNSRQFYIRDEQGNTLALYRDRTTYLDWSEQHLYGSSRLGIWNYGKAVPVAPAAVLQDSLSIGSTAYELTNHLGNVLSSISDKKIGVSSNSSTVDYDAAEVLSQNDYYPFGMGMPGRKFSNGLLYRFGFNGQEKSDEIKVDGNSYTAEFWEYDSRTGRRWNIDIMERPWMCGYAVLGNSPIYFIDPDGADWYKSRKSGSYDWFDGSGRQKGYRHMKTGTWSARNKAGFSYYFGNAKDELIQSGPSSLAEVTITAKSKKYAIWKWYGGQSFIVNKDLGINAWTYGRVKDGSLSLAEAMKNKSFAEDFTNSLTSLQRIDQAERDYRVMSYGAAAIIVAPLAWELLAESGAATAANEAFIWGRAVFNEAGRQFYFYGSKLVTATAKDLLYAVRYSLQSKLTIDQIIRLERMAEKYRDVNKFYKEVKQYKDLFENLKKIIENH